MFPIRRAFLTLVSVIAFSLVGAEPTRADTLTFNTSDSQFTPGVDNQGWWSPTQMNNDLNDNYFTGQNPSHLLRNFFTFDLSSLAPGTAVSATLEVVRYEYNSPDASETLGLFDVSTPAATLNNNVGTSATIYNDLGTGVSYGTFVVNSYTASNTETLTFSLNAAAIADINAAAGGFFSIGGFLQNLSHPQEFENIFFLSDGSGIQRLIVETNAPAAVPEPTTMLLLSTGLIGIGASVRRRMKSR